MSLTEPLSLAEIRRASQRLRGLALKTPLIRLQADIAGEFYLKLENLQPIGSFKLRGAGNALAEASATELDCGVFTASAGNMAQGVGWVARQRRIPFQVVVPDHAPKTKLAAIERLGGEVILVPFADWWEVLQTRRFGDLNGFFVHPVSDRAVVAGNATIGLEIVESLPDVDTILVPFGGGGLSCGIASALRELRPQAKVIACEVDTAAPLRASLEAGRACSVSYEPTFVDGIGGREVLQEMWPLVQSLIAGSEVVSVAAIAQAIRLLVERHRVVAEGAGATGVAVALSGYRPTGKTVCVVSGGNLDTDKLVKILQGGIP